MATKADKKNAKKKIADEAGIIWLFCLLCASQLTQLQKRCYALAFVNEIRHNRMVHELLRDTGQSNLCKLIQVQ